MSQEQIFTYAVLAGSLIAVAGIMCLIVAIDRLIAVCTGWSFLEELVDFLFWRRK